MKSLLPLVLVCGCSEHGHTPEPFGVPISGGTMLVTSDGAHAVIADPDRDRIVTIDLATDNVLAETALQAGDEPGRVVEDAAHRVHVALRRGNAVLTLDAGGQILERRDACVEPRGLAYDAAHDQIHVACATGQLVSFAAAGGPAVRSLRLERDLRDVIVQGTNLVVTRFRTAELLTIDETGAIVGRVAPPTVPRFGDIAFEGGDGSFAAPASTAWRTIAMPDGRIVMSHQRRVKRVLDSESPGGYGGSCGGGPIEDAVSVVAPGQAPTAALRIANGALPVDIAASVAGDKIAVVSAGSRMVSVVPSTMLTVPDEDRCEPPEPTPCGGEGSGGGEDDGLGLPPGGMGECCEDKDANGRCDDDDDEQDEEERLGAPTSVAWTPSGDLLVYYPEAPAVIVRSGGTIVGRRIELPGGARNDRGRNVFHQQTRIGVACASCHPEGRDDGIVWNFVTDGERRTQSLAGNILGRAPYHWTGDESSLPVLLDDVFAKRMSGGTLTAAEKAALGPWLDRVPAPAPTVGDPAAIERGREIFETPTVGCVACHNGPLLTNNLRSNVGTGGSFKVPSLVGVGSRAPFLHNGCAATLADRFGPACSGAPGVHGDTSQLTAAQIGDLVQYLESL